MTQHVPTARRPAPPGTPAPASTGSRTRGCSPAAAPTSTTSRCRGCCTRASCAVPFARAAHPRHRHVGRARRCPACARCSPPPTSTPTSRSSGTRRSGPRAPRRRGRRSPTARCASSATRSRWSSPRAATLAEDAAELVDVDYEPLPGGRRLRRGRGRRRARPRAARLERHRRDARPARRRARRRVRRGRARGRARRSSSRRTPRCRWKGAVSSSTTPAAPASSRSTRRPSRRTRCGCSAPACSGIPEHRVRVVMRDTGGGFGQKIMVQRDEMCLMLAAPKVGVAGEVGRGPAREPARRRAVAPRARRRPRWRSTPTAPSRRPTSTSCPTAAPTPRPGRSAPPAIVGVLFPGPYRVPPRRLHRRRRCTRTPPGRSPYRGPWQFESLAREVLLDIAARQMGMDPVELRRRNLLRRDELPYANPNGMTYDSISPLETFEQALAMLDYDAFRAEQADARTRGRYLGVGLSTYVEPSTPGFGYYATEAATIRIEPSGAVNVYIAGGSTGNSIETTVVQLTADALGVDIDDVGDHPGRHRGDRLRRRRGREPQRIDDRGRGARDRGDPARAHRRHRRPQARGGPRRHRARRQPGERARHAVDRHLVRRARRARVLRPVLVAAGRAGRARGERPVHGRHAVDLGERHAPVHLRGRRRSPAA